MLRVLLVDPDRISRLIAKASLNERYSVLTVSTAYEAETFLRNHAVDVVAINVTLVVSMDCIDLLNALRPFTSDVKCIIATTAYVDVKRQLQLEHAGFDHIIRKPLTLEKFDEALEFTLTSS